jgi:adenylyl-sulfate reductase (glutathione)
VPVVQVDPVFEGLDGGDGSLIKFNPLSNLTSQETWNFLRVMGVPTNKLHACGFDSIGCEPCTKAVLPNQHEREGRWWWEDAKAKECGLHSGNIKDDGGAGGSKAEVADLYVSDDVTALDKAGAEGLVSSHRDRDALVVVYAPWCQWSQAMEADYVALAAQLKGRNVTVAKYNGDSDRDFVKASLNTETFPTISFLPKGNGKAIKYPTERRDAETLRLWVEAMGSNLN